MSTRLDDETANALLETAIANVRRDYPVHWTQLLTSADDLRPHRAVHPVFAGSYDWHSCVHQTWLIVRLLRLRPHLPAAAQARAALEALITEDGCATEAAFFASEHNQRWERPYGWAWLFVLVAELRGGELAGRLTPLADVLRGLMISWLGRAKWPTRVGTHANTAFACSLALDVARAGGDVELGEAITGAARRWYGGDTNYGGFEPDAADFLSPALVEIDVMRRVLSGDEFTSWVEGFLPDLDGERWGGLREPVTVDDPTDPLGSHLVGLALSRAWCWRGLAAALPKGHRFVELANEAAEVHRAAGWRYVFGYGYASTHWLGTFAAYLDLGALT